jgi:hypothetical protein
MNYPAASYGVLTRMRLKLLNMSVFGVIYHHTPNKFGIFIGMKIEHHQTDLRIILSTSEDALIEKALLGSSK